jgi:NTE family protein
MRSSNRKRVCIHCGTAMSYGSIAMSTGMTTMIKVARVLVVVGFFARCAHYPVNTPSELRATDLRTGYRWAATTASSDSNDTFVILAFSGGGTRAAALSYAVLRELDATPLPDGTTLLDHVKVISAVSGGSFTAMYYGLKGRAGFDDFERNFLERSIQAELFRHVVSASGIMRLLSRHYHTGDLASELYDERLFGGATFADLLAAQRQYHRPFIIINATELEIGARFEWTQDQFDVICSDLSRVRVARAVAASSATPVLFAPVVVKKYERNACGYEPPRWLAAANGPDAYLLPARQHHAAEITAYLNPRRQYLHLSDGGRSDSLALRAPLLALTSTDGLVNPQVSRSAFTLLPDLNLRLIKRLAVIVVNAGAPIDTTIDMQEQSPSLLQIMVNSSTDNYAFEGMQVLLDLVAGRQGTATTYYPVLVAFPLIRNPVKRQNLENIGVNLGGVRDYELDAIRSAAHELLSENPSYQQLLKDLQAAGDRHE